MIIQSDAIYTEKGKYSGYMEIENGHFIRFFDKLPKQEAVLDYRSCLILPGFIDIHTHGYDGHHAQAVDKQELIALKKSMTKAGVTGFLPTAGAHFEQEYDNLKQLADCIEEQDFDHPIGAQMLGIHMEGPFLNPERRGAFQPYQLLPADIQKASAYLEASRHHIVYMALAPELDPDGKLIQYLKEQGVKTAGAHTTASYEEYERGIQQGLSASTHTGNGMCQIDRRNVGALGAALLNDDLYCEAICDFHHVDPRMLDIMFRVKKDGCRKFIMISDSTEVSGLPKGTYTSDGMQVTIQDNGLILDEEGTIMGSAHDVLYGFQNLKNKMKLPIEDILMMTSLNPASLLGIADHKGSILENKDADFIILNQKDELLATYVQGNCVYQKA
ncbi:MAG: N-acetylglucosamine-6-phosphate deacetylase [Erysipelotrichaceae bacterium]|nr:N-acetylglucosamine-6-phosphate deacetylase [Erysipelotrichaceae bacterium]